MKKLKQPRYLAWFPNGPGKASYRTDPLIAVEALQAVLPDSAIGTKEALDADRIEQAVAGDVWGRLEVFRRCVAIGLFPPEEILQWLARAFDEYQLGVGHGSLDRLLELRPRGPGQDTAAEVAMRRQRDVMLFVDMDHLVRLRATQKQAAEMVLARLQLSDRWNRTGWPSIERGLSVEGLVRRFRSWPGRSIASPLYLDQLTGRELVAEVRFVKSFPINVTPARLKNAIKPRLSSPRVSRR